MTTMQEENLINLLDGYAEIEEILEADSPRQFRRWTARLDANKDMWEECIFTDDRPANTAAAAQLGFATHTFTTPARFEDYLRTQGLEF